MGLSLEEAKQIPITEFLSTAGLEPTSTRGNDLWYYSPFRNEQTPSFKVNVRLNVWYDHGAGEGGTIIDLGIKLHQCSIGEFLKKLGSGLYRLPVKAGSVSKGSTKEEKLEILNVAAINNRDLIRYIKSRSVSLHLAHQFCRQVDFRIEGKEYQAVGFQNRSGGFELRNRWFKGSSSPKDITMIAGGSDSICVAEGFMDFLSILTLKELSKIQLPLQCAFLILNSLSFLNKNQHILSAHKDVFLFLDNDAAGQKSKSALTRDGISFHDKSPLYASCKDVNEFLVKDISARSFLPRPRQSRL